MVRRRSGLEFGWVLGASLALAGCVEFEKSDEGPAAETGPVDESAGATTEAADTGEPTPTTGGGEAECSLWDQDCPAGSKCMPYDSDSDNIHDTERCVPVSGMPGQDGDDCKIEGAIASGLDTCGVGLMCWQTDAENNGRCVTMCSGAQSDPKCPDGLICDISNGGVLILCVTPCDPLTPSCPIGQVCLPSSEQLFVCDVDASGDMGGYADPCAFVNVCDEGLLCAPGASVPGCKTDGCCTEFCDLSLADPNCSGAPDQQCAPFYMGGAAPPGYENVGVCSIPL